MYHKQNAVVSDSIKNVFKYFLLIALLPFQSALANTNNSVNLGDIISIDSKVLGERREIVVHTPADYDLSQDTYLVIYLLDGEHNLLYTAGIIDYLQKNQYMPKVILVAINNVNRVRDFTPTPSKKNLYGMPQMGGADNFISFIENELKPKLSTTYRVAPYSILLGHSYGGIFSIYSQQVRPSLFDAHIAISPSIFYDERVLVNSAKTLFAKSAPTPDFLYMSVANEYPEFANSIEAYVQLLKEHQPNDIRWKFESFPEETHMSSLHHATINGLKLLFKDWYIKDIPALLKGGARANVESHYKKLSAEFGYNINIPAETLHSMGFFFLSSERIAEATDVFNLALTRYPNSGAAHFNLAQAHKAAGNTKQANELISKACELASQMKELGAAMFCDQAKLIEVSD